VVATGGLSIPKMGATRFGYELAQQFGLKIRATRPALVPLVLDAKDRAAYCDLAGVSAEVVVRIEAQAVHDAGCQYSPHPSLRGRGTDAARAKTRAWGEHVEFPALQDSKGEVSEVPLQSDATVRQNLGEIPRLHDGRPARSGTEGKSARHSARNEVRGSIRQEFREKMLITHRGLSGPAILQISSYWSEGQPISIDLAPGRDVASTIRKGRARDVAAARAALRKFLPSRLAARWLELHEPRAWTNQGLAELERQAHAWIVAPAGTEGYEKAEVTAGGVDTGELSSKTMEGRRVPGLFFIGEVVDVTGHLGGHNFQWAWASGAAAGRSL
jgi:predicted flavoprotein YhiN